MFATICMEFHGMTYLCSRYIVGQLPLKVYFLIYRSEILRSQLELFRIDNPNKLNIGMCVICKDVHAGMKTISLTHALLYWFYMSIMFQIL